jgi:cytochrome c
VNCTSLSFAFAAAALAGVMFAQSPPAKSPSKKSAPNPAVARGKDLFDKKCSLCHNADSDSKKIGPGLKGLSQRGTFTVKVEKVTDESLKVWIENGDALMPPFKDVLEADQIKDVVAYVKTL